MFILKTSPKVGHTEIKFNANVLFLLTQSKWVLLMAQLKAQRTAHLFPDDNPTVQNMIDDRPDTQCQCKQSLMAERRFSTS